MTRIRTFALVVGSAVLGLVAAQAVAHCGKCAGSAMQMQKAMDAGKVTLASAVTAAEAHSKGKAVTALAALDGEKVKFTVHTVGGGKHQDVTVDGTGKATKMEESKLPPARATQHEEIVKALEASKVTLGTVIAAGETHSKGKAMATIAEVEGGKVSFEVYALAGDKLQEVAVDSTGKAAGMKEAKMLPGAAGAHKHDDK